MQLQFERREAETTSNLSRIEHVVSNMKYELPGIVKREVSHGVAEGLRRHRSEERPDIVNEVPSGSATRTHTDY